MDTPQALNTNAATDATWVMAFDCNPQLATDGQGNWVAVWSSDNYFDGTIGQDMDIFVARSSDNGITWTPPQPLNANAFTDWVYDDVSPRITTDDGQGNWIAVWSSEDDLGGTIGNDYDVLVSHSSDNGVTWTPPQALDSNAATDVTCYPEDDFSAHLATDGRGNWIAVWSSWRL